LGFQPPRRPQLESDRGETTSHAESDGLEWDGSPADRQKILDGVKEDVTLAADEAEEAKREAKEAYREIHGDAE